MIYKNSNPLTLKGVESSSLFRKNEEKNVIKN